MVCARVYAAEGGGIHSTASWHEDAFSVEPTKCRLALKVIVCMMHADLDSLGPEV